eukprot:Gb_24085 [translate_table: standard]
MGSQRIQMELNVISASGSLNDESAFHHHICNSCNNVNVKPGQVKPAQVAGLYQSPTRTRLYDIEAKNLCYKLVVHRKPPWKRWCTADCGEGTEKHILRNVSCEARPGEILAIAGPSGAGKSTLLEVLAGRIRPSSTNSILVNQQPMNISHFRRISGYVTQDDALFPLLTVEETLMFSAKLRLPCVVPEAEKIARVKALLNELGLQHVSASRIGNDDIRGISGGERRRVSIGVDVIHDPAVLLLDEPTSGLDSAAALQVIVMLKSMAGSHGRTIILSIHQPGFRILQLFNSILLLANGSVVHHGSLEMLQCRLIAAGHEIPAHVNVLEYAIDAIDCLENDLSGILAKSSIEEEVPQTRANPTLHDLFLLSGQLVDREQQALEDSTLKPPYDDRPSYANSSIQEIMILTHRFSKNIFRTKQLFAARTLQALVAGFGLGTIFMNVGYDTTGMQERVGFFAFSLTFLLSSTTEGLPIFLQERNILMRETSRGAYRVSSYVVANALVFLPFLLTVALLYATPVYWLVGLSRNPAAFLYFVLVVWLVIFMANSFVACFSALVPNFIMGNSLIAGFMGSFFLFSGYFIAKENIPSYWIFMHYMSLFKYPFEAFLINEYSNLGTKCFENMFGACTLDGNGFLAQQGLHLSGKWTNLAVMGIFIVVYRLLCFLILRFRCSHARI